MKFIGYTFLLSVLTSTVFAMNTSLEQFNKKVIEDIDVVLEDNPEVYERPNRGRFPASVGEEPASTTNKLDKFEEQADGQKSW